LDAEPELALSSRHIAAFWPLEVPMNVLHTPTVRSLIARGQSLRRLRPTLSLFTLLILFPALAVAQSPFDSGFTAMQTLFTGTVAKVASLIAIVVGGYQFAHGEPGAKKTVNHEVGFLLRILGDPGDLIRIRLRKRKMLKLKVRQTVGKAFTPEEKSRMLEEARKARSPHIYLALTLALNAGMRDAEIKTLTWGQIDFAKKYLAVGRSKTEAGEGRTIPLNSTLLEVFSEYGEWYRDKFGKPRAEWFVFPFGKPSPSDPTRPVTTLKTAWNNVRTKAKVTGRWHDNRHTMITDLAESGAGDQTIMDIAGHVSKQMLSHYSHIRMEAKRSALEAIVNRQPAKVKSS
jgi:integrase